MKPGNLPDAFQSNDPPSTMMPPMRGAVPAEELRQGVDHDIRAVLERPHQVRRRQRVVDDQRHAGVVRFVGDALDVEGQ